MKIGLFALPYDVLNAILCEDNAFNKHDECVALIKEFMKTKKMKKLDKDIILDSGLYD